LQKLHQKKNPKKVEDPKKVEEPKKEEIKKEESKVEPKKEEIKKEDSKVEPKKVEKKEVVDLSIIPKKESDLNHLTKSRPQQEGKRPPSRKKVQK